MTKLKNTGHNLVLISSKRGMATVRGHEMINFDLIRVVDSLTLRSVLDEIDDDLGIRWGGPRALLCGDQRRAFCAVERARSVIALAMPGPGYKELAAVLDLQDQSARGARGILSSGHEFRTTVVRANGETVLFYAMRQNRPAQDYLDGHKFGCIAVHPSQRVCVPASCDGQGQGAPPPARRNSRRKRSVQLLHFDGRETAT